AENPKEDRDQGLGFREAETEVIEQDSQMAEAVTTPETGKT
ncbi:4384_t:CDS:1, partial [Gigaspora rosea]